MHTLALSEAAGTTHDMYMMWFIEVPTITCLLYMVAMVT